jgi:trehalose/maltose hydrolase-like predicted phosphorylase
MPMFAHSHSHALEDTWSIAFDGYDPEEEGRREALCALGNGYFVTRASAPEATADDIHYPGTYRAGLYNRLSSSANQETVEDESIVNLPNWLSLTFRIEDGDWFGLETVEILAYQQILQLRQGFLWREVRFRDRQGRQTTLREQRFVSMDQPHLAGLRTELTAENWSGKLEIRSAIDGRVINNNVPRYAPLSKRHLSPVGSGKMEPEGIWLTMRTCQSQIDVAMAARTRVFACGCEEAEYGGSQANDPQLHAVRTYTSDEAQVAEHIQVQVNRGERIAIEKVIALYTSRDPAISESTAAAQEAIQTTPSFAELFGAHQRAWERLWLRCDFDLDPVKYLEIARLHTFHLLQTVSPHTVDLDVGVPARGWTGEDYRGHIFWDETFVLSFLSCRFPAIVRAMLLYRYRRLGEARRLARQHGYRGAMFPWRSASTGREETPRFQFNPLSKRWMPDHTYLQHHIGAIIAYTAWQYYLTTNDMGFLCDWGAELIVEIARFWASIATYQPERDRYEIRAVVGPDEYHTAYPGAETPGIHNNTYTNVMAVWTLCCAQEVLEHLPPSHRAEIWQSLDLSQDEIDLWDKVSRQMYISFDDNGILSQYEEFDQLQPFDLEQFRDRYSKQRIERTLEAEGDDINRYQMAKQADVAVLFFLLSETELTALFDRLGYALSREQMQQTLTHYFQRTAHESSLSRLVYTGATAKIDPEFSWQLFTQALFTDCSDGNDTGTETGIHLGAMAGTLHILYHCYLGLQIRRNTLYLNPSLPSDLNRLRVALNHQGNDLTIELTGKHVRLSADPENRNAIEIVCQEQVATLQPGASIGIALSAEIPELTEATAIL